MLWYWFITDVFFSDIELCDEKEKEKEKKEKKVKKKEKTKESEDPQKTNKTTKQERKSKINSHFLISTSVKSGYNYIELKV